MIYIQSKKKITNPNQLLDMASFIIKDLSDARFLKQFWNRHLQKISSLFFKGLIKKFIKFEN